MSAASWIQFLVVVVLMAATAVPGGRYLASVYGDRPTPAGGGASKPSRSDRWFTAVERPVYRLCGIDPDREQRWTSYAFSLIAFSLISSLALYLIFRTQRWLPLNPTEIGAMVPHLSFNTAVSFATNTNWQSYGGEDGMGHIAQMLGATVQNFASAAVGMAVAAAFIRGLVRQRSGGVGNFWTDLVRSITRVLLPLSIVVSVVLMGLGVVQNLSGWTEATTLEGVEQSIPGGPVASQVAIRQLGTNGGGFYNTNAAHPFENPSPATNIIELWAELIIPLSFAFAFGRMVKDRRQGWAVVAVMATVWLAATVGMMAFEGAGNPRLTELGADQSTVVEQAGGNAEGKEIRFGPAASGLYAAATTGTSTGSVNAMHDSFTPLGGGIALLQMQLGEMSPGGVGSGLVSVLIFAILAVFIAGLMVGRTPEYLGKKIEAAEMKVIALYLLAMPITVLGFTAASLSVGSVLDTTMWNTGTHGFSEILYAFTSAGNNNGSAFAGITAGTPWMNTTLGLAMLIGRYFLIVPVLALAGSFARKPVIPAGAGTLSTHTPLFVGLVIGVVVIIGGLTFFPALALGPIVEHLSL